jgi:hypothetical protein
LRTDNGYPAGYQPDFKLNIQRKTYCYILPDIHFNIPFPDGYPASQIQYLPDTGFKNAPVGHPVHH